MAYALLTDPSSPPGPAVSHEHLFCLWDFAMGCNYRCSYCTYDNHWGEIQKESVRLPLAVWGRFWTRMHERYGRIHIGMAGAGEPFWHPDVRAVLSLLKGRHCVDITTNLSWRPDDFWDVFNGLRLRLHASFHPQFAVFKPFLEKLLSLWERGVPVVTSIVAHPSLFHRLEEWRRAFQDNGVTCLIKPFRGLYAGRPYPPAYSEEEKAFLRRTGHAESVAYQVWDVRTLGKPCRAGQKGFHIASNGDIRRCSYGKALLGRVTDGDLDLLDGPRPCPSKHCTCAALSPCLVENDERRRADSRYFHPA